MRVPLTSRWLLATGLVVSMLLCCCHGKMAGRAIARLVEGAAGAGQVEVSGCCSGGDTERPTPPADDGKPCDCRTMVTAKSLPDAKTAVESAGAAPVAPLLVAWIEPGAPAVERIVAPGGRALERPSMSLLRQHCALIV